MKNIDELLEVLTENQRLMISGERDIKLGKEINNVVGKVLSGNSLKMNYQQHMGFKKDIDFIYTKEERLEAIKEEIESNKGERPL